MGSQLIYNGNSFDVPLVDQTAPRCILTVDHETVTSQYNYTLSILHKVLNSDDWREYIKDGDYIRLITNNDEEFTMDFNIDPYYGDTSIGDIHHIDMISRDLIPSITTNQYEAAYSTYETYPGSDTKALRNGVHNALRIYYDNIPNVLKRFIIRKGLIMQSKYKQGGYNRYTNLSTAGENMQLTRHYEVLPELWGLFKYEIDGLMPEFDSSLYAYTPGYEDSMRKYRIFDDDAKRIKCKNSVPSSWWTTSFYSSIRLPSGNNNYGNKSWYYVKTNGSIDTLAGDNTIGIPLCFRFV